MWDRPREKLILVNLQTFQPSASAPLDFQNTIERTLRSWQTRYNLRECWFDPYQMQGTTQNLRRAGMRVTEWTQSLGNLAAMAQNPFELVRSCSLSLYPNEQLRRACLQAVVTESARGWRIANEKQAHKIDPLIALAMACLAAVEGRELATSARLFDLFTGELLTAGPFQWPSNIRSRFLRTTANQLLISAVLLQCQCLDESAVHPESTGRWIKFRMLIQILIDVL